ncbi:MAG TPA: SDR family oxidoreductase [Candidatus Obscuribacter sp.]|nr:SDR family oxidoreductase [Candidatus Obscuribacter sp.]HNB18622.1 SDR family oxidoreductase [Candidatus Obscuribacter sp.]HNG75010.1 SDR family oxidoreductase [Candidatus Obscuribacter sp.]HNN64407.1 SDR family oxidoreductase [Candidatus Obscuribacter sp.]
MDFGLKGKVALVTGASRGIGRAIADTLAAEGAEVLAVARSQFESEGLKTLQADLTDAASRKALMEEIGKRHKGLDILVHNVGGPKPTDVRQTSLSDWQEGFERLFLSVAHLNEGFVPGMVERGFGRIVCVTSLSIMEPIAGLAVSNGIRSAVTAMLKTLADEVAPAGVTVNCVAPGAIATERLADLMEARIARSGQSREDYERDYLKQIPAGRLGTPAEFASLVAYLCSTQAAYVTGSTICVDGGKRRSTY